MRTSRRTKYTAAAALLALATACGNDDLPAAPTPTAPTTPTVVRMLLGINWDCNPRDVTEGDDVRCRATANYDADPVQVDITAELTSTHVQTSDPTVLEPDRYRADIDGTPFVIRTLRPGNAETWAVFNDTTSNREPVTVNAASPVRTLLGINWECDRREATEGDDVLCRATANYDADPLRVDITAELTPDTVRTSNPDVLRPNRYDSPSFVVNTGGPGTADTWVEFERLSSARWTVDVRSRPADDRWRGIRVVPEAGRSGYERPTWNVTDTDIHRRDGSPACTPYTRTPITRVGTGDGLDREHIVALAEAWDSRPAGFNPASLRTIAEDHANLTLAEAGANRSKSDRDAAEWQPQYNGAWMAHRVVEVKRRYDLSVDPAERDSLERLLGSGPDQITCNGATPPPPAADHPPVQTFRNCTLMREAGWNRGVNRNGGTYRSDWNEPERRTYALNTARDRDGDGHACE